MRSVRILIVVAAAALAVGALPQSSAPPGLSPAFSNLLNQYRTGDVAEAIVAFSRWPEARVIAESTKFEAISDRTTLAAIAMFHTEAGIVNGKFGDIRAGASGRILLGGWGLEDNFEPHSYTANRIVDGLLDGMKTERDAAFWRFGLDWYVVAMSTCQYRRHFACTVELLDKGESYFEDQGRYRLIQGSVTAPAYRTPEAITLADERRSAAQHIPSMPTAVQNPYAYDLVTFSRLPTSARAERTMVPGSTNKSEPSLKSGGSPPEMSLARAGQDIMSAVLGAANGTAKPTDRKLLGLSSQAYLQEALKLDPSLAEARIRLGHIWYLRLDPRAPEYFKRALADAQAQQNPFLVYLAAIYLGQWQEERGDLAGSVPYYRVAYEAVGTHMSALNLSQALIRLGQGEEGWAIGRKMFGRPGSTEAPDPLDMYPHAQYWQVDALLERMRELVRAR